MRTEELVDAFIMFDCIQVFNKKTLVIPSFLSLDSLHKTCFKAICREIIITSLSHGILFMRCTYFITRPLVQYIFDQRENDISSGLLAILA